MPYNVTERNLEHWMNPTRVQVSPQQMYIKVLVDWKKSNAFLWSPLPKSQQLGSQPQFSSLSVDVKGHSEVKPNIRGILNENI